MVQGTYGFGVAAEDIGVVIAYGEGAIEGHATVLKRASVYDGTCLCAYGCQRGFRTGVESWRRKESGQEWVMWREGGRQTIAAKRGVCAAVWLWN